MTDRRPKSKMRGDAKGTSERLEATRIRLLGGFEVNVGARTIEEGAWRLRKAANLVKLLALAAGNRLHREQVMYTLWPELGISAASNNLRQTVHTARRTFDLSMGSRYLATRDESLVLCPESSLWVDVDAFEEDARIAHRSREPAAYRAALDLYAGELLPTDRYEEWAEEPRRRLQERYLSLLLGLAHIHEERADYDSAIEALGRVFSEEPVREGAHAGLMRLYALKGSNGEALAQYERLEEILQTQLGTLPAASSRALREEISAGRFPPNETHSLGSLPEELAGAGRHNLPAARTSFVGREQELVEVKRELAMTRLLTLTGTGESGKTRLALEVAKDLVGSYPDGVWLVELAPLTEGALVPQAVADALGVLERPGQPLTDTLAQALRAKSMLLVVDNCEKLEERGEAEAVLRRRTEYFLALAEDAEPRLRGPEDVEWLERLEGEHDNIRAALSWVSKGGEVELGLRLGGALWMFWEAHGHYSEGRRWLEEAVEKEGRASAAVRAKALYGVSHFAHLQSDTNRAEAAAQEGIELCAEAEIEGSLVALFRWKLGYAARLRGDYERAKELLEESLTLSREADDKWGIADALFELGTISLYLDDLEWGKARVEEAIDLCRMLGYGLRLADLLTDLGHIFLLEGDFERGAALSEEAVVLYRERGYKGGLEFGLTNVG